MDYTLFLLFLSLSFCTNSLLPKGVVLGLNLCVASELILIVKFLLYLLRTKYAVPATSANVPSVTHPILIAVFTTSHHPSNKLLLGYKIYPSIIISHTRIIFQIFYYYYYITLASSGDISLSLSTISFKESTIYLASSIVLHSP